MKDFKSYKSGKQYKSKKPKNTFNKESKKNNLRHSWRWRQLSKQIRSKYHYICQDPRGCEEIATSVHHIKDAYNNSDLFFLETNLIPLCERCHRYYDNNLKEWPNLLKKWKIKVDQNYE